MSKLVARRPNRFRKHPILSGIIVALLALVFIEAVSALLVWGLGHTERRSLYEPNRIVSGYTVYRHTPGFSFGSSTIRYEPDDPPVIFDDNGFICDEIITEDKPEGVIRIFLMGGSTAISAGQTSTYAHPKKYPWGVYTYRYSLAGQLRDFLERQLPGKHVQVITAAVFGRKLHQSLVEYLSTVSRFAPDSVITLEGMNDLRTLVTGSPWRDSEAELPQYIDLWREHYRQPLLSRTNTAYVVTRGMRRLGWLDRHQKTDAPLSTPNANSRDEYLAHRDQLVRTSKSFLRNLRQFKSVVNADGATFVFALQPMLHRVGANKKLTELEKKFDALQFADSEPEEEAELMHLVNRYFLDDYLSDECARRIQGPQAVVVDCNRELQEVGSDVEFYTDYCHLTFEGNQITAEILGRACLPFVRSIAGE